MGSRLEGIVAALSAPLLVFALGLAQPDQALVVAAVAALLIAVVIGVRRSAASAPSGTLRVGGRAAQHRNVLDMQPTPQHPHTAGRRRSRAPSSPVAVA